MFVSIGLLDGSLDDLRPFRIAPSHTSATAITLLHSIYGLNCVRYNPSIGLHGWPSLLSSFYRLDSNLAVLAAFADRQTIPASIQGSELGIPVLYPSTPS